jgi:hypothetical protein
VVCCLSCDGPWRTAKITRPSHSKQLLECNLSADRFQLFQHLLAVSLAHLLFHDLRHAFNQFFRLQSNVKQSSAQCDAAGLSVHCTQVLTSFKPRPESARTSLMTLIFDDASNPTSFKSKNSFAGALSSSGAASGVAAAAGAAPPAAIGIMPPIICGITSTPARPTLSCVRRVWCAHWQTVVANR